MNIEQMGKGALIQPLHWKDYRLEVVAGAGELPATYSIKDKVGKIKAQYSTLSCVSQATAYYTEVLNFIETGIKEQHAPRFLYSKTFIPPAGGSYTKDNFSRVCNAGIALESEVSSYDGEMPPSEQFMRKSDDITPAIEQRAMTHWAKNYVTWNPGNISLYKQAIIQGNGCVVCSYGTNDSWKTGDVGFSIYPGEESWYHGIYLVGYDDNRKAFEFVNSWGETWGYGGFGWLPYEYITRGYVSNPLTLIDLPNQQYSLMMKLIGLYKFLIEKLKGERR